MRLVALISGLLLCASGLAQNDSIPWSRLIADPKKSAVEHLLLSNDSSLYLVGDEASVNGNRTPLVGIAGEAGDLKLNISYTRL